MPKEVFDRLQKKRVRVDAQTLDLLEDFSSRKADLRTPPTPGIQTFVNETSALGLPPGTDDYKDLSTLPGVATPGGKGREVSQLSLTGPDSNSDIPPRTLGIPGEEYGHPTKFDYNTVTRRTMTSGSPLVSVPAYGGSDAALPRGESSEEDDGRSAYLKGDIRPPRIPGGQKGRSQRKQSPDESRDRRRRHRQNQGEDNQEALKRYHAKYKKNRKMRERKKKYTENPRRYKRKPPKKDRGSGKVAAALWYHGSPKRFEGMETSVRHTFGLTPSEVPLFFSPSESFAKGYAQGPDAVLYTVRLKWQKVFDGDDMYGNTRYWPPEYEALTREGKKLHDDLGAGKIFSGVDEDDWSVFGDSQGLFANILKNHYDVIETTEFKKWLKKNGYDAAYVTGDGEKNVFVFSPKQVEIVNAEDAHGKPQAKVAGGFRKIIDEIEDETGLEAKVEVSDWNIKIELKRGTKMVGYFRASTVNPKSFEWDNAPTDCIEAWSQMGEPPIWVVRGVEWFDRSLRGKGFGKLLYKALFSYIASQKGVVGPDLCSGGNTSPDAQRVWKSLRSKYPSHGPLIDLRKMASATRVASRHGSASVVAFYSKEQQGKRAGDLFLYDQENPANNEIKQPGKDVDYRAEGPTTYTFAPDEKKGVVPSGQVPSRQMDNAPPVSSRVIPDSMKQTLEDNYTKAAAATIPTILDNCGPAVTDRSKGIKVKRKRLSPSGMSTWSVQGSSGEVYTVRVKPIRKNKRYKIIAKMPVKVSCSCQFWRWQGPEHWGKANDFLYGKPRGTASVPVIRDPIGEHWACKHLIAVLQYVNKWRYAADAEWSYEGPFAPLPDEGRVAARYLEAKRQLWWHGTSGKNLRSVLKQGLIPTGDLVFDVEVDSDRGGGRSIKTFGGTYFSSQWFTAYSSAGNANRKSVGVKSGPTPYSKVIIGATLDNRSPGIMLDEDDMLGGVETLMGRTFDDVYREVRLPEDLVDRWSGSPKSGFYGKTYRFLVDDADYGDLPAKYLDHMVSKYPKLEGRVERQRGALESAIRDVLAGYSAHLLEVWYHRYKDSLTEKIQGYIESAGRRDSPDLVRQYEDELKQHLADEREIKGSFQLFQKATNRLGQMMREATEMPEGAWRHNIRTMRPVTYRGKDRILMVASISRRDSQVWKDAGHFSSTEDIIFHYGAQQRKPFLDKFEERVGGIARVLDGSGKVLEIIDKRGQLEERGWPTDLWGPAPRAYRDVAASASSRE